MVNRGIFITGTDTGVGKTYIGTGIVRALRRQGTDVGVMKPAETGCLSRRGVLMPLDALALRAAAGADDDLDLVNPYRFREPLAPAVAAARAGMRIDLRRIMSRFQKLAQRHEYLIVEGAGGIMVPLSANRSYLDLASLLELPVLIVARPGLGTINHTLLTVMALLHRKVPIAGIVVNHGIRRRSGPAEQTSPAVIGQRSGVPVVGVVRHGQKDLENLTRSLIMP